MNTHDSGCLWLMGKWQQVYWTVGETIYFELMKWVSMTIFSFISGLELGLRIHAYKMKELVEFVEKEGVKVEFTDSE